VLDLAGSPDRHGDCFPHALSLSFNPKAVQLAVAVGCQGSGGVGVSVPDGATELR